MAWRPLGDTAVMTAGTRFRVQASYSCLPFTCPAESVLAADLAESIRDSPTFSASVSVSMLDNNPTYEGVVNVDTPAGQIRGAILDALSRQYVTWNRTAGPVEVGGPDTPLLSTQSTISLAAIAVIVVALVIGFRTIAR